MDWNPWFDLYIALLDNFCRYFLGKLFSLAKSVAVLITKEEKRGGVMKRLVVSRVRKFYGLKKPMSR